MSFRQTAIGILLGSLALPAFADDDSGHRRWWRKEIRDDYWNRPCEYKIESKPGEFKREIKCRDGIGARWRGEWKEEFRDGRCLVKIEATREVFKEEVKCEGRG
jgi:hypothetical protein